MKGIVFVYHQSINKCSCDGLFDSWLVSNFNQTLEQGVPFLSHVLIIFPVRSFVDLFVCLLSLDYRGKEMAQWVRATCHAWGPEFESLWWWHPPAAQRQGDPNNLLVWGEQNQRSSGSVGDSVSNKAITWWRMASTSGLHRQNFGIRAPVPYCSQIFRRASNQAPGLSVSVCFRSSGLLLPPGRLRHRQAPFHHQLATRARLESSCQTQLTLFASSVLSCLFSLLLLFALSFLSFLLLLSYACLSSSSSLSVYLPLSCRCSIMAFCSRASPRNPLH